MSDTVKSALIRGARTGAQAALGSPLLAAFLARVAEGTVDLNAGLLALTSAGGFFAIGFISFLQNVLEGAGSVDYNRG